MHGSTANGIKGGAIIKAYSVINWIYMYDMSTDTDN